MIPTWRIEIVYCRKCRFQLRAVWLAQELLSTFEADLQEVALVPGTGGVFEVRLNGDVLCSYARDGGFPEAKDVRRAVRDRIAPGRALGHTDSGAPGA